jgi:hypothetical protein
VKRERRQLYIEPWRFEKVRREAFENDEPYSDVIERALDHYFAARPPRKVKATRRAVPA